MGAVERSLYWCRVLQVDITNNDRYWNNKRPRTITKLSSALSLCKMQIIKWTLSHVPLLSFEAFKYVNLIKGR